MKIALDAGHGFNTAGKRTPDGMKEYEFNRVVAIYAKEGLLNYQNVEVIFTHSDERDVPLSERTNKANAANCDVFVSIHANAYGSDWNSAHGIETFAYTSKPKEATALATVVQKHLVAESGLYNRGVKFANFHVLRETNMTAILCENGFMTNKEEAALLKSDGFRRKIAKAIVDGLVEFYGLKEKPKPTPAPTPKPSTPTAPSGTIYRVQVGAFKVKANADALAKQVKAKGFDAFVKLVDGLYKVQVGAYSVKANADAQLQKLKNAGFNAFITTK